jgi:hypothetical protein
MSRDVGSMDGRQIPVFAKRGSREERVDFGSSGTSLALSATLASCFE